MTTTDGLLSRSAGEPGVGERLVIRGVVLAILADALVDQAADRSESSPSPDPTGTNIGEMRVRRK